MRYIVSLIFLCLGIACMKNDRAHSDSSAMKVLDFSYLREIMVERQIKARGVRDERVLAAMRKVPRHLFVPEEEQRNAYQDNPLPIGYRQTISQPYIVAYMTEALQLDGDERVLEIGTGSGYQAAVLAELADEVFSIEIVPELCRQAKETLAALEYENVHVVCGDGYEGLPQHAPFDAIMITASPPKIPQPLVDQLKTGGRMVLPVGKFYQELVLVTKSENGKIEKKKLIPVRFVPMTGKAQKQ